MHRVGLPPDLLQADKCATPEGLRNSPRVTNPSLERRMHPLLSTPNVAVAVARKNDPRDEITEEEAVVDSTLVAPTPACHRATSITQVSTETTDEN